ncbi:collagen binding domain-containing protein [Paenibacillus senegalensis]|uniref:collagen binding domain-containing protein n=1 Tax=Paenibacillus senegalensis TaxID=1465766 RepID=UPI00028978BB|nr:LPXTG cell wall anchor domain-containing protein [Paenibacillus senegalensis]
MIRLKQATRIKLQLLLICLVVLGTMGGFTGNLVIVSAEGSSGFGDVSSNVYQTADPGFGGNVTSNVYQTTPGISVDIVSSVYQVPDGRHIDFTVTYTATRVGNIKSGDELRFTLPEIFTDMVPEFPKEHFSGCAVVATEVVCTFGGNIESALQGYMILNATVSRNTEPGKYPIEVRSGEVTTTIDVEVIPYDPSDPSKRDLVDKWFEDLGRDENGHGVITDYGKPIQFTIRVNRGEHEMNNATVVDVIPAGMELIEGSLEVYQRTPVRKLIEDPNITIDGNTLTVYLGNIDSTYDIKYKLKITELHPEYKNDARLTADGIDHTSRETVKLGKSSGAINVLKSADKERVAHDDNDQIVTYTIQFYSFGQFAKDRIVVTDIIDDRVNLLEDSIEVSEHFSYDYSQDEHKLTVINDQQSIGVGEQPLITFKVDFSNLEEGIVKNVALIGTTPSNEVTVEKEKPEDPSEPTPTPTPTPTPEDPIEPTPTPTPTPTPEDPSEPTPTPTPTPTPEDPSEPTPTPTPTPEDPSEPTPTPIPTPEDPIEPTPTPTPTPEDPEIIIIEDEEIAQGNPAEEPAGPEETAPSQLPSQDEEIVVEEEPIPLGTTPDEGNRAVKETAVLEQLPKTGEASPIPYYVAGMAMVILGLMLRRAKRKSS